METIFRDSGNKMVDTERKKLFSNKIVQKTWIEIMGTLWETIILE